VEKKPALVLPQSLRPLPGLPGLPAITKRALPDIGAVGKSNSSPRSYGEGDDSGNSGEDTAERGKETKNCHQK
jgi:hypothetical protein